MKLTTFTIKITTTFGHGIIQKRATTFQDAFKRISLKNKKNTLDIWDEKGFSIEPEQLNELLQTINHQNN